MLLLSPNLHFLGPMTPMPCFVWHDLILGQRCASGSAGRSTHEAHASCMLHKAYRSTVLHLCFKKIDKFAVWLNMRFRSADKSLTFSGVVLHEAQLVALALQMRCNEIDLFQHENIALQMCFNSIDIYAFNIHDIPSSASWSVCFICASFIDFYCFDDVIRSCDLTCPWPIFGGILCWQK